QEPVASEGAAKLDTSSVTPDSWPRTTDPTAVTQEGQALGTAAYMSPEQAEGRSDLIGPASDVYSLGATLYTVLTGEPPFQGRNAGEILAMVKHGNLVPPRRRKKDISPALEAV